MSLDAEVLAWVIRRVHSYHLKHEVLPEWKMIPRWIDSAYIYTIRKRGREEGTADYRETKNILIRLHKWFFDYSASDPEPCLINLPVAVQVDNSIFYSDTIDIIGVRDNIKMFDFKEISNMSLNTVKSVYADIEAMTRIWGLKKATGIRASSYNRIYISPTSINIRTIAISNQYQEKIDKVINYLLGGISRGVFFPSFTDHCINCKYNDDCSL